MNTVARLLLRTFLACALLLSVPALRAQPPSQQWSVGVLDQILAAVPPGQNLAQVGDMQILTSILKAWRDQLAGAPYPNIAFGDTATTWPGGLVYYTFDSSVRGRNGRAFFGSGTTTNSFSCTACDPDHDGLSNYQEFLAGTNPTNSASSLRITSLTRSGSDINVSFQSQPGIVYRLDARASAGPGAWSILADQILGTGGVLQVTDPGVAVLPQTYYRVDVQP